MVVDPASDPIAVIRGDGAPKFSIEVAMKKAWTSAAVGAPSNRNAEQFLSTLSLTHFLGPGIVDLMPVGGATPIVVDVAELERFVHLALVVARRSRFRRYHVGSYRDRQVYRSEGAVSAVTGTAQIRSPRSNASTPVWITRPPRKASGR